MSEFENQVVSLLGQILEKQTEHDEKFKSIEGKLLDHDKRFEKIEDTLQLQNYKMELLNQKLEVIMEQTAKNTVQITQLKKA